MGMFRRVCAGLLTLVAITIMIGSTTDKRLADLLLSLPILVPIAICGAFASIHRRSGVPTLGEANCYFALF